MKEVFDYFTSFKEFSQEPIKYKPVDASEIISNAENFLVNFFV